MFPRAQANVAAKQVFELLDAAPKEEDEDDEGSTVVSPISIKGDVAFKNLQFEYPTRPEGVCVCMCVGAWFEMHA